MPFTPYSCKNFTQNWTLKSARGGFTQLHKINNSFTIHTIQYN